MGRLDIKKFNPSLLRNAIVLCEGKGYMRTYNLNNGYIFKEVKDEEEASLTHIYYVNDFIDCLEKKLLLSRYLDEDSVVLPKAMYYKDDRLVGYTIPFINMHSFDDIIKYETNFQNIIDAFVLLSRKVKDANRSEIILPDLGNTSNIFYDPKAHEIRFIDYDGLQIGDCESFNVSTLMSSYYNPTFEDSKYFDKETTLYTPNFDKASLFAIFLYYTTKTNLTYYEIEDVDRVNGRRTISVDAIKKYLSDIGLDDSSLEEEILTIFNLDKNNNYLETSIKRLSKTHRLDTSSNTFRKI